MSLKFLKKMDHALGQALSLPRTAIQHAEQALHHLGHDQVTIHANLPPYTRVPAAALAAAEARSTGRTLPQPLQRSQGGGACEPVTLEIAGTQDQLVQTLQKAGWTRADKLSVWTGFKSDLTLLDKVSGLSHLLNYNYGASPMSGMSLNGKPMAMAFNKNDDHHSGRDHLRVFETGRKDPQGRPIWAITATRDEAIDVRLPSLNKGHHIQNDIDPERDMIMADLLRVGIKDWHVAQGQMSAADQAAIAGHYATDHKIYQVDLNG